MTRMQTACYALVASAFVLAGLFVFQIDNIMADRAEASLVIARENFTLMTTNTRSNEEGLFVLDNTRQRLLVYRLNVGRGQLELAGNIELARLFQQSVGRSN